MSNLNGGDAQNWDAIAPHYHALQEASLTPQTVAAWLQEWSDLTRVVGETGAKLSRAKSEDTTSDEAQKAYLHFITQTVPKLTVADQSLKAKLLSVEGWEPPADLTQMLKRLRADADLFREANVPLQAEIAATANRYDTITGAMSVMLNGEELTLQQAAQKLQEPERSTREETWRAMLAQYGAERENFNALFLKLLAKRRQLARNAGLTDYREYAWRALKRFDYTPQDSLAFGEAIEKEIVPLYTERLETRRKKMGLDTLRPWDLDTDPAQRPALIPFSDPAELESGVARIFDQVDPELGAEFAKLRNGFLDLGSRRGKAPGGHCSFFPKTGLPYIFMNAVGTAADVRTMLHEAGHAFHGLSSNAHQTLIWNLGAPMEFNEVASMAMELLSSPYLEREKGGFFTAEEASRARTEHLDGMIAFLPYMAVVDGWQHWVYSEAPEDVTAQQLDAKWKELWKRFMPVVSWEGLEDACVTGWHRKLHIFKVPFYYVEYGLAQLGALQVWRNALANQAEAVQAYRSALALGNTRPLPELFSAAGARLAFDAPTLHELAGLIKAHLAD